MAGMEAGTVKTLTIEFPDAFPGEQVVLILSPAPLQSLLDIVAKRDEVATSDADFEGLFALFVPFVQSWTFPEEVSVAGLLARDLGVVAALLDAWVDGVRNVPRPLVRTSGGTTPSGSAPAKRSRRSSTARS